MEHGIEGRELKEWITQNDLMMKISDEQAEVIVKTLLQEGWIMEIGDESLLLCSIDEDGLHEKETSIDDIIDLAAEINYEHICNLKSRSNYSIQDLTSYCNELKHYICLHYDKFKINQLFKQTIYAKNINNYVQYIQTQKEVDVVKRTMEVKR
ncbi:hypothetical protein [uncultured Clostridium sp.]|uniref:hypothetical protein n=1 Tax=uncultured Clostridium sp. TaxID=59620 RepID=UPI0025E3B438|nr:hypothetical protein [uncultured Clostridium sp.]